MKDEILSHLKRKGSFTADIHKARKVIQILLNISIPVCWNDLEPESRPEAGVLPGIRPELVQIHQQN